MKRLLLILSVAWFPFYCELLLWQGNHNWHVSDFVWVNEIILWAFGLVLFIFVTPIIVVYWKDFE